MNWLCAACDKTFSGDRPERCECSGAVVHDFTGVTLADRYRVQSLQGTGSQDSTVWLALQLSVDRPVAIKLMPINKEVARQRFARGAKLASMLNHPNITTVHDYGETDDDHVYMVMELLVGRTLREEVQGGKPIPLDRSLHIISQVLRALEEAHSFQVVHRDLKPDNLYLCPRQGDRDFVKVLDFGIAKLFETPTMSEEDTGTTMDGQVTRGWQLCGTPLYMAPEQISGESVDGRTDIYALGVVMHQMLTGRVPFRAKTQYAVLSQHLRDPPPAFREVAPELGLPAEAEKIVARAMSKHPSERFETAYSMRMAIQQLQEELGLRIYTTADVDDELPVRSPTIQPGDTSVSVRTVSRTTGTHPRPQGEPRSRSVIFALIAGLLLVGGGTLALLSETASNPQITPMDSKRHPSSWSGSKKTASPPSPGVKTPAGPSTDETPGGENSKGAAAPEASRRGLLLVDLRSTPSGARVMQGARQLGVTPMTVSLLRDQPVTLHLRHLGYEVHTFPVDPGLVPPGGRIDHHVTLQKKASKTPSPARRRDLSTSPIGRPEISPDRSGSRSSRSVPALPERKPRIEVLED